MSILEEGPVKRECLRLRRIAYLPIYRVRWNNAPLLILHWPSPPWLGEVFGWLLQICYDADGNLIPAQTVCINQQLMYDDYGKNPPTIG
jgi:hypothetical protein